MEFVVSSFAPESDDRRVRFGCPVSHQVNDYQYSQVEIISNYGAQFPFPAFR